MVALMRDTMAQARPSHSSINGKRGGGLPGRVRGCRAAWKEQMAARPLGIQRCEWVTGVGCGMDPKHVGLCTCTAILSCWAVLVSLGLRVVRVGLTLGGGGGTTAWV